MTYHELVNKVKKALTAVDASSVSEHVAVQVNVTGEAEGIFYIEAADGKLAVEPYDYVDRDVLLTVSEETLLAVAAGKQTLEAAVAEGAVAFEGDYGKAMLLNNVLAQLQVKKTRKTPAKKAAAKEETAAEAAPAKRKCGRQKKAAEVVPAAPAAEAKPAVKKTTKTKKATKAE